MVINIKVKQRIHIKWWIKNKNIRIRMNQNNSEHKDKYENGYKKDCNKHKSET